MAYIYEIRVSDAVRRSRVAASAVVTAALRFRGREGTYFLSSLDYDAARGEGLVAEVVREIPESALGVRFTLPHDGAVNDPPPEHARLAVLARLLAEERIEPGAEVQFLGRHRTIPPGGFVLDRSGGGRRYVWKLLSGESGRPRPEIAERFQTIRALFADPSTRVVLSLGAGGLKLFGHAPALRLLERIGCAERVDEVWGSSAGALVALLYCHGLSPAAIEQTGYDLYSGRYALALRPSKLQVLRELAREALAPSHDAAHAGFVDCASGLSRMLEHYCDRIEPIRPLYTLAFNLETCATEVLTPAPVPDHLTELMVETDAREGTLASCAVPLLFVPRRIRRGDALIPYIDGSTTEDVPLYSVVRKWDLDRAAGVETRERLVILYVKLSSGLAGHRGTAGRLGKLRLLQTVATAGMETIHQRDVALIGARPDVELLPLELEESSAEFFEIGRIPEYIRRAKESFPAQLEALEQALRRRDDLGLSPRGRPVS